MGMQLGKLTGKIIGSGVEAHKVLGSGPLQSVCEKNHCYDFSLRGLAFKRHHSLAVAYRGIKLDRDCVPLLRARLDIVVAGEIPD